MKIIKKMSEEKNKMGISRRDVLKSIATIPVIGAVAYGALRKKHYDTTVRKNIQQIVDLNAPIPEFKPSSDGKKLRLGIIGIGGRGGYLLKAAGFLHPESINELKQAAAKNNKDKRYEDFMVQEDLNIEINGICDIFDKRAEWAIETCANIKRTHDTSKLAKAPKRYRTYKDLLSASDIDAVIIATPDHWHAPIAIEAAKQGKHIYVEKPMTWNVPETYELRELVKRNKVKLQVGHQGRQTESYIKAKEAIEKGILGKISLVQVCTNRNSPNGAWVYPIDPEASPETIDWDQFIGQAPYHPFSLPRFFRWRCWWDYSTGLNGDLLTHEFDAINQVMGMGIPDTVTCSGGVYYFNDGRTVPDVMHAIMEFKEKEFSLLYSATLANGHHRGKLFMGHDATMEMSNQLIINAERESTKYHDEIESGLIDPNLPIYHYIPGTNTDGYSTATEQYFASRGLLYTYRGGKRVDTSHLHIKEWLEAIRDDKQPSCHIDAGFEEAITAHMTSLAIKKGRRIYWDKDKEKIEFGDMVEKEDFDGNDNPII
jgi:predicted dehydrogenase